jgi:hypothetical protein
LLLYHMLTKVRWIDVFGFRAYRSWLAGNLFEPDDSCRQASP